MPHRKVLLTRKNCRAANRAPCHGTQNKKISGSSLDPAEMSPQNLLTNDTPRLSLLFNNKKKLIMWLLLSKR